MTEGTKKPTTLGGFLILFGIMPLITGILALSRGIFSSMFLTGFGAIVSGILLFKGKKSALIVYGITYSIVILGSLLEIGLNFNLLLPRILLPTVFALFIFIRRKTRDALD